MRRHHNLKQNFPTMKKCVGFEEMVFAAVTSEIFIENYIQFKFTTLEFMLILRNFEFRSSTINGAHFLRLHNGLDDSRHISLEIKSPLVKSTNRHRHFSPHFPSFSSFRLLQRFTLMSTVKLNKKLNFVLDYINMKHLEKFHWINKVASFVSFHRQRG